MTSVIPMRQPAFHGPYVNMDALPVSCHGAAIDMFGGAGALLNDPSTAGLPGLRVPLVDLPSLSSEHFARNFRKCPSSPSGAYRNIGQIPNYPGGSTRGVGSGFCAGPASLKRHLAMENIGRGRAVLAIAATAVPVGNGYYGGVVSVDQSQHCTDGHQQHAASASAAIATSARHNPYAAAAAVRRMGALAHQNTATLRAAENRAYQDFLKQQQHEAAQQQQ